MAIYIVLRVHEFNHFSLPNKTYVHNVTNILCRSLVSVFNVSHINRTCVHIQSHHVCLYTVEIFVTVLFPIIDLVSNSRGNCFRGFYVEGSKVGTFFLAIKRCFTQCSGVTTLKKMKTVEIPLVILMKKSIYLYSLNGRTTGEQISRIILASVLLGCIKFEPTLAILAPRCVDDTAIKKK